jgi:hypothetical protein
MPDNAPLSALYYPHTSVADEGLLRDALLLWDRMSFIVPWAGFGVAQQQPPLVRRALELVAEEIEPGKAEKDAVYQALTALVERGVPEWLTWTVPPKTELADPLLREQYAIYPQKLDDRITRLMYEHKLAHFNGADGDIYTNPALGLMLMALLARECAGVTKHTVTDRGAAYQWLAKYAFSLDSAEQTIVEPSKAAASIARLHMLTLGTFDMSKVPLSRVVEMREREQRGNGADYRKFRHNYLQRIQSSATRMASAKNAADLRTIEREYEESMRDDLAFLQDALDDNTFDAICSKDTGIAIATTGVSSLLSAGVGAIPGALGVLGAFKKWYRGRTKALSEHPMAWMYIAKRRATV